MASTAINGTSGNDVIVAHSDASYTAGKLVFHVSATQAQNGWPLANVLINGNVVLANVLITADARQGQVQTIEVAVPPGPIDNVQLQYLNDIVISPQEDRNIYLRSVTLNGHDIPLGSGTYFRQDMSTLQGQDEMAWNGYMVFSGPLIQAATPAGLSNSSAIDGLAGVDTVLYQGRGSDFGVGLTATGLAVAPRSGAFETDTLTNVERALFDDRGPYGEGGAASVTGAGAQRTIDGGMGIDTLLINGSVWDYTIDATAGGFNLTHNGAEGTDLLVNVERLQFLNANIALDIDGNAGMAYRLYQAAFDRTPDLGGLGYQMRDLDNGLNIFQVAQNFINSPEFGATYGNLSTGDFVRQLYLNVLDREPDAEGYAYHTNNLDNNGFTRANVLVGFSESPENQATVIGTIENGMVYTL